MNSSEPFGAIQLQDTIRYFQPAVQTRRLWSKLGDFGGNFQVSRLSSLQALTKPSKQNPAFLETKHPTPADENHIEVGPSKLSTPTFDK